jgi:phosphoribosylformimino-5-aminoimidazole carboxamide ribotide isomerase
MKSTNGPRGAPGTHGRPGSAQTFEVIPAIDLIGGRVVRLAEGDFARETVYGDDPVAIARRWAGEGATRLHIVDLDGARAGRPAQTALIARVVAAVEVPCQVAGGLRDAAAAALALRAGADRVVMGSALLRDPELARRLVDTHGSARIVSAIDVRDGMAVGSGWVAGAAGRPFGDILAELRYAGVELFAVTAIARDGLQEGPDLELLTAAAAAVGPRRIIASAGVSTVADIAELSTRGYAGAILGRALYEGTLELGDALAAATMRADGVGAAGGAPGAPGAP